MSIETSDKVLKRSPEEGHGDPLHANDGVLDEEVVSNRRNCNIQRNFGMWTRSRRRRRCKCESHAYGHDRTLDGALSARFC